MTTTPPLDEVPSLVHGSLVEFFHQRRSEIEAIDAHVVAPLAMLEDMVLGGGKRLRPLFAWVGYLGAGGSTHEHPAAVITAVSALELIQACALIHDDIIDASDTRRGVPTVHRRVEALHRERQWLGSSADYGEATAILVGDMALAWADEMLYSSGLSMEALQRIQQPWSKMKTEVIAGQLLDISVESSGDERVEVAEKINRYKTAAYTIERPLHIGAAIAQATPETVAAYTAYGRDIGIAYQLRDDTLGVFGDPEITGKPAGDDLREGKRTVLLAEALRRADDINPEAAARLRAEVGHTEDPAQLRELADIISELGAEHIVEKRITELTESGLKHLETTAISEQAREELEKLAVRATKRQV